MLDASVNDPVLVNVNSRFHLRTKNRPLILYPEIIVSLVKAWRDLERDYHVTFNEIISDFQLFFNDIKNILGRE